MVGGRVEKVKSIGTGRTQSLAINGLVVQYLPLFGLDSTLHRVITVETLEVVG